MPQHIKHEEALDCILKASDRMTEALLTAPQGCGSAPFEEAPFEDAPLEEAPLLEAEDRTMWRGVLSLGLKGLCACCCAVDPWHLLD